ncbi:hypothetical protein ASPVEDRAFT_31565 [Aspergillus versicolor CBS 583.65]|uniref:C2H2-type domain-containing protein n=1 Tax=Aspergillus versicolor CBS 583.65 TaxID=1036611 RepID=A0A1L9PUD3_ASPVE|nr:uncharacterized protein ASPVEDRAFT_31565 [Aspergillus versicolor CBS 583.65]OJJ05159.1 hypothetical protein ASPVEDRAFT_31565 [Aspergillus versicolor CBS 583.65]
MPPRKRTRLSCVSQIQEKSIETESGRREAEKAFHCSFCTRAFHRKEHLQRHERLHTKEKPFRCTICPAGFARRDLLARHTGLTHEKAEAPHGDPKIENSGYSASPSPSGAHPEGQNLRSPSTSRTTNPEAFQGPAGVVPDHGAELLSHSAPASSHLTSSTPTLDVGLAEQANSISDFDLFIDSINGTYDGDLSSFYVDPTLLQLAPSGLFPTFESLQLQDSDTQLGVSNRVYAPEPRFFDEFTSTLPSFEQSHEAKARREPQRVTQRDWDCLFTEIQHFSSVIPTEFFLPSRHTMTRYISTYFAGFHRHLPFIHLPTFSTAKCPVELILSMATIGAISAFENNNAVMLYRAAFAICNERLRQRNEQWHFMTFQTEQSALECPGPKEAIPDVPPGETKQPEPGREMGHESRFDPLPLAQALLILMAMATWGNSEAIYDEAIGIQNILINYLRAEKLLERRLSGSPEWDVWIKEEGFTRTIAIIYCFFNFHTIIYDLPPPLLNSELEIRLPSRERDWEADSEQEWQQARSKHDPEPDFQSAFALLFSPQTEKACQQHCSSLGGYTLILALIQHIYFLRSLAKCRSGDQTISPEETTSIERALINWQGGWNQDPESFLGPGSPLGPISFNSTALLRMAYIRLNVDLGPWRALNTHIPYEIALSMYNSPPPPTNSRITRAVLYSAHALSIPVKIGINIVKHNQAFSWSLQHSLCALECAFIISKWLIAIQPDVTGGTMDEEEARLHAYIVDMATEAEAGGEMDSVSSADLCTRVVRIWAVIFSGKAHWNVVRMIGKILDAYAKILECGVFENEFLLVSPTTMSSPSPINAAPHIQQLLSQLHKISLEQEAGISKTGKVFSADILGDLEDKQSKTSPRDDFDRLMLDKFIALDEDKCQFVYQLINATGATNVVEAGTSFGVSTIYLALAIAKTTAATGKSGVVIATEKESEKAAIARKYWAQCGPEVEQQIDLREGDLLQTLRDGLPEVDLLLLDIWSALALPTLKTVLPRLRPGAVVLTDNTISGAKGYADLLAYLREPANGFQNMTLPFTNGFEMSVYRPDGRN